jgi:hypothetical protein
MTTRVDPDYVLAQYEALRCEALSALPGHYGHGLTVLLTRGMPAWLAALAALAPRPPLPPAVPAAAAHAPSVPGTVRAELTTLLAAMVLACAAEGAP